MITIAQVEEHFAENIGTPLRLPSEWKSYPEHYISRNWRDFSSTGQPEWTRPDSAWKNSFEVAEYNRHNGSIVNWWSPTIEGDKITGWTKLPGMGHTLSIWS